MRDLTRLTRGVVGKKRGQFAVFRAAPINLLRSRINLSQGLEKEGVEYADRLPVESNENFFRRS
jgi:hypothetical protein